MEKCVCYLIVLCAAILLPVFGKFLQAMHGLTRSKIIVYTAVPTLPEGGPTITGISIGTTVSYYTATESQPLIILLMQCTECKIPMNGTEIAIKQGETFTDPSDPCKIYMCLVDIINHNNNTIIEYFLFCYSLQDNCIYSKKCVKTSKCVQMIKLLTNSLVIAVLHVHVSVG